MNRKTGPRAGLDAVAQTEALAAARSRSFRQAGRHTYAVKLLKVLLPLAALASVSSYAAFVVVKSRIKDSGVDFERAEIDPKNLKMVTPSYNGFGKDGSRYNVRARDAVSDLKQTAPVRMNGIEGTITQPTGVETLLKATWGTYDQKQEILELYEQIDIDSTSGMRARLTRATVMPKESRVVSPEPVVAENETGLIRAKQMTLNTKTKQGTFEHDVYVKLRANQKQGAAAPALAVPAKQSAMPGLSANSGQPIEVKAGRLDVDDVAKTALFRRDVIARQGDAVMQAPELDVLYEGKTAIGDSGAVAKGETKTEGEQSKLKTIKARGGVVMTNKDDRATASSIDYDATSERIVLAGNVVMTSANDRKATAGRVEYDQRKDVIVMTSDVAVTQGKNVLKGRRLHVDRKSGRSRLESPAEAGQVAGRIQTVFYQQNAQKAGAAKKASEPVSKDDSAALSFKADPNAPIEIDAETLDIADLQRQAVYKGGVVAKQGEMVVRAQHLTAFYTGQIGIAAAAPQAKSGEKGENAQLTKVEMRQKVHVTGKDGQTAEGDQADYDVKANTIVMRGNVKLAQGRRTVVGNRLTIDMTTGEARVQQVAEPGPIVSAAAAATDPASAKAAATPPQKPRVRALIFRDEPIGKPNATTSPSVGGPGTGKKP